MQVGSPVDPWASESDWPVLVRLLGGFSIQRAGRPVPLRANSKIEALLCVLGLQHRYRVPRDTLLSTLWPDRDPTLASQSLNSLSHSLHKLLGAAIGGAPPVVHAEGSYKLNTEAGVMVDVAGFEALSAAGDRYARQGKRGDASDCYARAARLYRGDLIACAVMQAAVERERLRALYLTLLARLADCAYEEQDYEACLDHALRLLAHEPCREDAHRLIMRCYARRGERAQALRQYRLAEDLLRAEFDAVPEPATRVLYDQIRSDPGSV